jgi:uncharacterized membrane protein YagU involved in acid resistance
MQDRITVGAAAGFSAGFIMGVYEWLGFQSGLFAYNPFHVMASVWLPVGQALTPIGTITAIVVHLIISVIIGILFSLVVPWKRALLWGLGLGLFLQFFFGAYVTPTFTFVPYFWEMDATTMLYTFSQRMLFGLSLGYLYRFWGARVSEKTETPL